MFEKTKQFLREVKTEIKKVVYPSREELVGSTWVVIITVFIPFTWGLSTSVSPKSLRGF
jgi:preprotein translocase subunit SecE